MKKGLVTLVCLTMLSAMWSWAATTLYVQIKTSNLGGTVAVNATTATGTGNVKYAALTVADPTALANGDVVATAKVAADGTHKIISITKNGVAVPVTDPSTVNVALVKSDFLANTASGYKNPSVIATFADKTAGTAKTWQLQVKNVNYGGTITTTRNQDPAISTYPVGQLVLKNYPDTAPVTVKVVATTGYHVEKVTLNGVAQTLAAGGTFTVNPAASGKVFTVFATYKQDGLTVTGDKANGVLPASVGTTYGGTVTLMVSPTGTQNLVKAVTVTGTADVAMSDAAGTKVAPFRGTVKVVLSNIKSNVSVTAQYDTDPKVAIYQQCSATCHATSSASVRAVYGEWDASKHSVSKDAGGKLVDCINCHSTMPGGVVKASVDANTFKITAASAGTVGASYCATCHDATANAHINAQATCTACHNSVHNPAVIVRASFLTLTSAQAKLKVQKGDPAIAAATGYAGSESCRACHNELFASWSDTLHNKPLKQLSETGAEVLVNKAINPAQDDFATGLDFNAVTTLTDKDGLTYNNPFNARKPNAPVLGMDQGGRFIKIGLVKYYITRAHGGNGKWKQRYQTKIGNAYYVLNVMWNEGNGRYAEYNGQNWYGYPTASGWTTNNAPIFTIAGDNTNPALVADLKTKMMKAYGLGKEGGPSNSSWDNRCTGCHQTGMQLEYAGDDKAGEVVAGYVELNVGCESCHGPAAAHAAAPTAANVLNPQKAFVANASPNYFKADEVCGQCHNRTEGAGHLGANGTTNLVNLPTESPSKENAEDRTVTVGYNANSADRLNDFVEKYDPGTYGPIDNSGTLKYDGANFPKFAASNKHHQTFNEVQQGKHGAIYQSQAGNGKGLSCWSCHDPHANNSSNMRKSINGVATNKDDNSLCLACHNSTSTDASNADFAGLAKSSIGNAADELAAVNAHLSAKLGHTISLEQYQQSVAKTGTIAATFGLNTIKVGNCISCHMPLTAVSGIKRDPVTGKTAGATGRGVGDVHNHTMKTLKASDVNGTTVTGGAVNGKAGAATAAGTTIVTSCSACHVTSEVPGWL